MNKKLRDASHVPNLQQVFDEIAIEIYLADAINEMLNVIGDHADEINSHGFGDFFGRIQGILTNQFISSMAKLFEKPRRYPIFSIPQALQGMPHGKIINREYLLSGLEACGLSRSKLEHLEEKDLKARIVRFVQFKQPHSTIRKLKGLRDKKVAHSEAIHIKQLEKPIWEEAEQALEFAKKFVVIGGSAYFNTAYGDQYYSFCYEFDARSLAANLKRLLRVAGIAKNNQSIA